MFFLSTLLIIRSRGPKNKLSLSVFGSSDPKLRYTRRKPGSVLKCRSNFVRFLQHTCDSGWNIRSSFLEQHEGGWLRSSLQIDAGQEGVKADRINLGQVSVHRCDWGGVLTQSQCSQDLFRRTGQIQTAETDLNCWAGDCSCKQKSSDLSDWNSQINTQAYICVEQEYMRCRRSDRVHDSFSLAAVKL